MNVRTNAETPVIRICDLANAYQQSYVDYLMLLEVLDISTEYKSMLASINDDWRTERKISHHEEQITELTVEVSQLEEQLEKQEEAVTNAYKELQQAEEALKAARKQFEEAQECLYQRKRQKEKLEKKQARKQESLNNHKRNLEKLKKYTLVHRTATLSSLDKKKETTVVCTRYDAEKMGFAKFADYEFHCEDKSMLEEYVIQEAKKQVESFEEFASALEYIKMVITFWAENKPYELLYSSKTIKFMIESLHLN